MNTVTRFPDSSNVSDAARQYVKAGFVLVAFDRGTRGKGPTHVGWNTLEKCISTVERARNCEGNVGIAHAYSRTCCIDIDDMDLAVPWFHGVGIDLQGYWDAPNAVRWTSGRRNRGKLLYRLPKDSELLTTRMFKADGIELRCATAGGLTVQDVLPPSIHPLTGEPYRWLTPGDWRNIPDIPADLLAFWLSVSAPKVNAPGHVTPLGVGRDDIEEALSRIKPEALDYDDWLHVGMALHHETSGDSVGLDIWDIWSQRGGEKYKGFAELEDKWRGFHADHESPRTLRTIERMASATDMSGEYQPVADDWPPSPAHKSTSAKPKFKIESATEFAACEYEDDFIDGVLPDAAYGVIMGQSGSAKTFAAIDLAFAMARGVRWRNKDTKPARVLYVAAEGAVGVRKRLKAYAQHHGIDLAGINVEFLGAAPDLTQAGDVKALIESINAKLRNVTVSYDAGSTIVEPRYTHIVIDTWSQVTPGADENNSRDMGAALKRVQQLHAATGARILFVAHMGKDVTKGMRGWSGFKAAMDYELEITRAGDQRTLTVSKSRDGQDGISFRFHLHPVTIGTTKRGKPVVSCVVIHDMAAPKRPPVGKVQIAMLAIVQLYFEANKGAWMPFEDGLQMYKKRGDAKTGRLQPKKDNRRSAVQRALLQLVKNNMLEEKDRKYRPFTIAVNL